ncbi:MAG: anthranilate phosphoribosyltransferase [Anaerolineaceae bacterium]|nr:anthranilate phosphoribosyltransferase [Anaerolineaceae bacterium]
MYSIETQSEAFRDILRIVGRGKKLQRDLTYDEAFRAMQLLLGDDISEAQIGAFLVTMRVKEETADEIRGFAHGARTLMQSMPAPSVPDLVDVGLPYDGKAVNLQTGVPALWIVAAAGVPVLLHAADHIPAKNGVTALSLLRAMGYPADMKPDDVSRTIERTNFGVLNIEHVLPQWTRLTPLRHHFGVRTLMNTAEKLLNPANAPRHISGFYHGAYLRRLAPSLPGTTANWIVQGEEGSIDIRPGKKTRVYRQTGEDMVEMEVNAADYPGYDVVQPLESPNDPQFHAGSIQAALNGDNEAATAQIILTAATLLWMLDAAADLPAGLDLARELWESGRAKAVLNI